MNPTSVVEAMSAGIGAALATGEAFRRYWRRREERQQAAFKAAVQVIVDESVVEMVRRQQAFERRQGQHLDRQDKQIAAIRQDIQLFHGEGGAPTGR